MMENKNGFRFKAMTQGMITEKKQQIAKMKEQRLMKIKKDISLDYT